MIKNLRQAYNAAFSDEKYDYFKNYVTGLYDHTPAFRLSESPVFFPDDFRDKLIRACDDIVDVIVRPDFKEITEGSMKPEQYVPNEDAHPTFMVVDFGICEGKNGELVPKLIEMQGFPSLYFFQQDLADGYRKAFADMPDDMSPLFNGLDREAYYALLRDVIVGDSNPENVVLLEVEPEKQNTLVDFLGTAKHLGIKILCLTKVVKQGRQLFYKNENGELIFDNPRI